MLNEKFKIKKNYKNKNADYIIFDRIKHKRIYKNLNVIVLKKSGFIKIKIACNYIYYNILKDEIYFVNY